MDTRGTERSVPARHIKHEIVQVSVLILVGLAAFAATRALAENNRDVNLADAKQWYERGQRELAQGNSAAAVESFRRAVAKNRGERAYAMALGRALDSSGDTVAAESTLLALRESTPEDVQINIELARLLARRGDLTRALRYYRSALYSPASAAEPNARRRIRLELIAFLLNHDDKSRALSELLVAVTDSADDVTSAVQLGGLLVRAGDVQRGQDQYLRALQIDPGNVDALIGAGTTAFQLGRYAEAQRYLRASGSDSPDVRVLRETANLVISDDPLGDRLGAMERQRRLVADLHAASARLKECTQSGQTTANFTTLLDRIDAFPAKLRGRAARESDVLSEGLDLIYEAEQTAGLTCQTPSLLDHALLLVGRLHAASTR